MSHPLDEEFERYKVRVAEAEKDYVIKLTKMQRRHVESCQVAYRDMVCAAAEYLKVPGKDVDLVGGLICVRGQTVLELSVTGETGKP